LIANMLGVRREGVTEAAGKLQHAGILKYSRGRITVLDQPRLRRMACECYEVVKNEFERLLPWDNDRASSAANVDGKKASKSPDRSRETIAAK